MSFYEQLCQLNDEDLPEIKWLETILDEMKPDREEVCSFIVKLEGEILERKQRLMELDIELRKQHRRLDFAMDCKECLSTYAATKLAPHILSATSNSFRPSVPPRSSSLKKATPSSPAAVAEDESDYMRLSDCYSARPEHHSPQPKTPPPIPEVASLLSPAEKSSTVRLRRPLENASQVQNAQGRRHTLDEEKMNKRTMERAAQQQHQNMRPLASNGSPVPGTKPPSEAAMQPYVNIDHFNNRSFESIPVTRQVVGGERDSVVMSPVNEAAMIDEHFGFLDNEMTNGGDLGSGGSGNGDVMTSSTENDNNAGKIAEIRKNLITGYIADQRDYLSILETVVKYSKAIKTTLTSPKPDVINAADFAAIFSLLPKIFEIEKLLIDKLDERMMSWSPTEPIFAPLLSEREKYNDRFQLYALYLQDYPAILQTATRCLKESTKFSETCGEIIITDRKQGKIKKRFEDVLLLPIVRLQSSGLALERIIEVTPLSHPDQAVLISMRQKLRTSLDAPNSVPALDGLMGPAGGEKAGSLISHKRQVLRPAVPLVEWVTPSSAKMATLTVDSVRKLRYTFLFTDVFVACKRRLVRNNRFQFEAVWWFQVCDLKLEDLPPAKVDQAVKSKLEELSHEILLIRRNLLSIARGFNNSSQTQVQEQRKKLQQLEEAWLLAAPLVPLRLYNAAEVTNAKQPPGTIATTNDSKLILFLSDFELGDWRRALHACQMRLAASPSAPVNFSKEFLTLLCNEVAEKIGISSPVPHPRVPGLPVPNQASNQLQTSQPSFFAHDPMSAIVATSNDGVEYVAKNRQDAVFNSMGIQQVTGQLQVTIHELTGLAVARQCSIVLCVDCFGHFQIQAQTRLSDCNIQPRWDEEFELDLNSSSALRVVCYSREPDGRDVTVGQSALQLTQDWLAKPFVVQPIGLLAAASTDPHLSLTLTIRYRPPHMTMRRRQGLTVAKLGTAGSLFGQAIGDVVNREGSETGIPRIVTECVRRIEAADGLNQEGLYRISGLVGEVKRIKAAFEKDISSAREQLHMADVNIATGVLKSYFRELPDPLFTEALSQDCLRLVADNSQQLETQVPAETLPQAAAVFERLPKANRKTAYFLLQHLCRVADRSDKNLMTAENLARIWGPTLLSPPTSTSPSSAISASAMYLQGQVLLIFLQLVSSGYKPLES